MALSQNATADEAIGRFITLKSAIEALVADGESASSQQTNTQQHLIKSSSSLLHHSASYGGFSATAQRLDSQIHLPLLPPVHIPTGFLPAVGSTPSGGSTLAPAPASLNKTPSMRRATPGSPREALAAMAANVTAGTAAGTARTAASASQSANAMIPGLGRPAVGAKQGEAGLKSSVSASGGPSVAVGLPASRSLKLAKPPSGTLEPTPLPRPVVLVDQVSVTSVHH